MATIKIKRGLRLPIVGEPEQKIHSGKAVKRVAVLGDDYLGMKPTMKVVEGDVVKTGQLLFTDKKMPAVRYTAPGAGKVVGIHRGAKRAFKSLIIELSGSEEVSFTSYSDSELSGLGREKVQALLLESGMWPSLRRRPFSKVADPEETPHSIFVTAIDTNPLAPDMELLIAGREAAFRNGLQIIAHLTDGKVHVCTAPDSKIEVPAGDKFEKHSFAGPHPAGNAGTHIHFVDPVGRQKMVWYIGMQDVIAIGNLFVNGKLDLERIVALGGPSMTNPRLIRTRLGASLDDLVAGELAEGDIRLISGSVYSGWKANPETAFLGKFHQQITALPEGTQKEFLGWLDPGLNRYSAINLVLSKLIPGKKFAFNTAVNGGKRAIVPIGVYEKVMPLDIEPAYLLRSLAVDDVEEAEKLGCLELDEEDLALCTFVCPCKMEYGVMLRKNLTQIEKEG